MGFPMVIDPPEPTLPPPTTADPTGLELIPPLGLTGDLVTGLTAPVGRVGPTGLIGPGRTGPLGL